MADGQRVCASCEETRLSAYNTGVLCSSCQAALAAGFLASASDGREVPVWVWGTAPVRRMLARLDLGRAVEVFRAAAGLTQAEAGAVAGWSGATIAMIENGTRDTVFDIRNLLRLVDAFDVPRSVLLPAILGDPGIYPDRRIALAEAGKAARPPGDYKPGEIMHIITGKLRARGLEIAERTSGDDMTEFTATNPADPGKGTVHVSCDGYVTWECLTQISGDIADTVTSLLGPYSPPADPGGSSPGTGENTRPPVRSGTHMVSASTGRGRAG